jgi:YD repeat-containing protein
VVSIQTLTAWDQVGRPTAGTDTGQSFTYAYDDTARVATVTNVTAALVIRQTFDANGILTAQVSTGPRETQNQTVTVHSTASVCR